MAFDWAPVIAAGVNLAQGLLQDEDKQDQRAASKEELILQLQDNERDRANKLSQSNIALEGTKYAADQALESTKKRILGSALLNQGQGQERLGIEAFRAAANRPERFNTAANILAQVLSR